MPYPVPDRLACPFGPGSRAKAPKPGCACLGRSGDDPSRIIIMRAVPAAHGPAAARLLRVRPWGALARRHGSTARPAFAALRLLAA